MITGEAGRLTWLQLQQLRTQARSPLLVLTLLGGLSFAACGGSSTSPTDTDSSTSPTYSFETIRGVWEGGNFIPEATAKWGEIHINASSVKPNDRVGSSTVFEEENGPPLCTRDLFAEKSDSHRYYVSATNPVGKCPTNHPTLDFRFEYDSAVGTLTWSWKRQNQSNWRLLADSLTRAGG